MENAPPLNEKLDELQDKDELLNHSRQARCDCSDCKLLLNKKPRHFNANIARHLECRERLKRILRKRKEEQKNNEVEYSEDETVSDYGFGLGDRSLDEVLEFVNQSDEPLPKKKMQRSKRSRKSHGKSNSAKLHPQPSNGPISDESSPTLAEKAASSSGRCFHTETDTSKRGDEVTATVPDNALARLKSNIRNSPGLFKDVGEKRFTNLSESNAFVKSADLLDVAKTGKSNNEPGWALVRKKMKAHIETANLAAVNPSTSPEPIVVNQAVKKSGQGVKKAAKSGTAVSRATNAESKSASLRGGPAPNGHTRGSRRRNGTQKRGGKGRSGRGNSAITPKFVTKGCVDDSRPVAQSVVTSQKTSERRGGKATSLTPLQQKPIVNGDTTPKSHKRGMRSLRSSNAIKLQNPLIRDGLGWKNGAMTSHNLTAVMPMLKDVTSYVNNSSTPRGISPTDVNCSSTSICRCVSSAEAWASDVGYFGHGSGYENVVINKFDDDLAVENSRVFGAIGDRRRRSYSSVVRVESYNGISSLYERNHHPTNAEVIEIAQEAYLNAIYQPSSLAVEQELASQTDRSYQCLPGSFYSNMSSRNYSCCRCGNCIKCIANGGYHYGNKNVYGGILSPSVAYAANTAGRFGAIGEERKKKRALLEANQIPPQSASPFDFKPLNFALDKCSPINFH